MTIDIIILSHSKTQPLLELTQRTIDSCFRSETDIQFNIIVFEQEPNVVHQNCRTIHTTEPFNYNGLMNKGIAMTNNEYVCLCNNDLVFHNGWATEIIRAMEVTGLLSACPQQSKNNYIPNVIYGYNNSKHMMGWCIMTNRKLYKRLRKLDEDFPFWFADNAYAEQLKELHIEHAVVNRSVVEHLGSSTLNTLSETLKNEYTKEQIKKFIAKYPNNESSKYFKQFF